MAKKTKVDVKVETALKYIDLKAQEKAIKAELDKLRPTLEAALTETGGSIETENGTVSQLMANKAEMFPKKVFDTLVVEPTLNKINETVELVVKDINVMLCEESDNLFEGSEVEGSNRESLRDALTKLTLNANKVVIENLTRLKETVEATLTKSIQTASGVTSIQATGCRQLFGDDWVKEHSGTSQTHTIRIKK